ncbi:MAG: Uncharacterised protein [Owenweeksia sp. TMED14]|nr:MAG: Uncharacterised protein [Owenweeksia sp. TMED14]|tara:strand:+ start:5498 stop:6274 length:777 start_codon:yes stop_codon:yes gene_type:complete
MKQIIFFLLITGATLSCTDEVLPEDSTFDTRNVVLNHFFYYNDEVIDTSKVFNLGNAQIIFKDVSIAFGGYFFTDHLTDTVTPVGMDTIGYSFDPNVASLKYGTASRLFKLDKGVYQGVHHFKMGIDSSITGDYEKWPKGHPMTNSGLHRGLGEGYNSLYINGLYKELGDTASVQPNIPFTYRVSDEVLDIWWNKPTSFNVVPNMDVNINIVWSIDKLLLGLDPTIIDNIECDSGDPIDFQLAQALSTNILTSYEIQL